MMFQQHTATRRLSDQAVPVHELEAAGKYRADVQDQKQYWAKSEPWAYLPVSVFAEAFAMTERGKQNEALHDEPHYTAAKEAGLDPLTRQKCAHTQYRACHLQSEPERHTRPGRDVFASDMGARDAAALGRTPGTNGADSWYWSRLVRQHGLMLYMRICQWL